MYINDEQLDNAYKNQKNLFKHLKFQNSQVQDVRNERMIFKFSTPVSGSTRLIIIVMLFVITAPKMYCNC